MAQRTYTIPDAQLQRVMNGVVYQNGYQDNIRNIDGSVTPNPVTKVQYFDQVTYRFWKDSLRAYEANRDADVARDTAANKVDSEVPL